MPVAHLSISLLGTFQVSLDGSATTLFESDKVRGLLAYLAVENSRPHRREALAALFWPDASQDKARQNLRRALYNLRQMLDPGKPESPHLQASRQTLQLDPSSDHWLDVAAFEALLEASQSHPHRSLDSCPTCVALLSQAIDLYRGDFLAGISLPESEPFEEWRLFKQEALHGQVMEALGEVAAHHQRRREYGTAARSIRRQLELEPWREEAHRQLMLVLALKGERSAALLQYETCQAILRTELGVEPARETSALRERIQAQDLQLEMIETQNPYKGLRAFAEADAPDFFGREVFVERMVGAVHSQPVTVVVGPSGSGKSSVVQAGLLPKLRSCPLAQEVVADSLNRANPMAERPSSGTGKNGESEAEGKWMTISFRPGERPLQRLAEVLVPLIEPELAQDQHALRVKMDSVAGDLRDGELRLADLVSRALRVADEHGAGTCRALLVVDQFEEIYTDCPDADSRRAFVDCLLQHRVVAADAEAGSLPFGLLISLRADFTSQALTYHLLTEAIQAGTLVLGPMTQNELRRAVEEPARSRGVVFEPGLLERLLHDAGEEPGNLPLLQFTLTLLWDQQLKGQLTHAAYGEIGGLGGALTCYADSVYEGLSPEEREGARRVLTQLVRLGRATQDTRRSATRAELRDDWQFVKKLADARLLVTDRNPAGQETVELVHEALIRHWELLRTWIEADQAFHAWHQSLREAWERWEASGRDEGALLHGIPLAEAEEWATERASDLPVREREFITASAMLRDQILAEARERHQRELERAQQLAEAEHQRAEAEHQRAQVEARARRRLRWTAIGYALVLVIALGVAIWVNLQLQVASRAQSAAKSLGLASDALMAMNQDDTDLALALSLEASRLPDPPVQALRVLAQVAHAPGTRRALAGHDGPVLDLSVSPDGRKAVSASVDRTLIVWDMTMGEAIQRMALSSDAVRAVTIGPKGRMALSGAADGSLELWDLDSGRIQQRLPGHQGAVLDVAISPDGKTALSGSEDGSLILWDLDTGAASRQLVADGAPVRSVGISPDGKTALSIAVGGAPALWDLQKGEKILHLTVEAGIQKAGPNGEAGLAEGNQSVVFGPEGTTAIALLGETVTIWNLTTGELDGVFRYDASYPQSVALSPRGDTLLLGTGDGRLVLLDLTKGAWSQEILGHEDEITAVEFMPDGRKALSASSDSTLRLWDLYRAEQRENDLSLDSLSSWITKNRYVPQLSCEQRLQYGIEPYCAGTGRPPAVDD